MVAMAQTVTMPRWMLQPVRHCQGGELPMRRRMVTTPRRRRAYRPRTLAKTAARGYGGAHARLRRQWELVVDAGAAFCHQPVCLEEREGRTRRIISGTPWDLGHTPDRTGWTGPEHRRCSRADGNRSQRRQQAQQGTPLFTSRYWLRTCKTCGKLSSRAARSCAICGAHCHPSPSRSRS